MMRGSENGSAWASIKKKEGLAMIEKSGTVLSDEQVADMLRKMSVRMASDADRQLALAGAEAVARKSDDTLRAEHAMMKKALEDIAHVDDDGWTSDGHERCTEAAEQVLKAISPPGK